MLINQRSIDLPDISHLTLALLHQRVCWVDETIRSMGIDI